MNKKYYVSLVATCVLFLFAGNARAISVTEDVTLQISGNNVTLTSGSSFTSLTIDTNNALSVEVGTGESVTLQLGSPRQFSNDKDVKTTCESSSSNITLPAGKTYAVSIGATCTGGGGGGVTPASAPSGGGVTTSSDTMAPTVSMTEPSNGATVSGIVNISATASDDMGVSGVQFKVDGVDVGSEDTSSPYSISWNTATVDDGLRVLTAVARDAAGNKTTSGSVTATVDNVAGPAPTPTQIPALPLPTTELDFGAQNDNVSKLQAVLAADPTIYPEGRITGYYGSLTVAAVKRLQERYGLAQVGRVGPQTLAKLAEVMGGIPMQQPPAPTVGVFAREFDFGMEGTDIVQLQSFLAQDPTLYPEGRITGYYGSLTVAAVKRFQERYGLAQVGRVGPQTLAKLNEVFGSEEPAMKKEPQTSGIFSRELDEGMSGDDVSTLQQFLAQDPELYPEGLITGYYGSLTTDAVRRFQTRYGLSQVGRVGPQTLAKLNEIFGQ